jgi:hypothetical protein
VVERKKGKKLPIIREKREEGRTGTKRKSKWQSRERLVMNFCQSLLF